MAAADAALLPLARAPAPAPAPAARMTAAGGAPPHYHVIGLLSAQCVFRVCVYMWVSTIIVCYITAVSLGHVPAWLPMISDCAVSAPEKYVFRLGFISGANWLFASSLLYYLFFRAHASGGADAGAGAGAGGALGWRVKFGIPPIASLVLAFLAAVSVAVVGAVSERENGKLHGFAAMSFFTLLQLYMVLTTYQMKETGLLNPVSYRLRVAINLMAVFTYGAFLVFTRDWSRNAVEIAICEWSFVSYIVIFEWLDSLTVSERVDAAAIEELRCARAPRGAGAARKAARPAETQPLLP